MIDIDKYEGSTRGERYQNCIVSLLEDISKQLKAITPINNINAVVSELEPLNTNVLIEDCTKEEIIKTPQRKKRTKKEEVKKDSSTKEV